MNIGKIIKALREKARLTKIALAMELKVPPNKIEQWETNQLKPTNIEIVRICTYFDVPADDLLNLAQDKN